jgi:hypothetical protein
MPADAGPVPITDKSERASRRPVPIHRVQGFAGQGTPGAEPLRRHGPRARLGESAPQLLGEQMCQAAVATLTGHVARAELGRHRQLPIPRASNLGLDRSDFGEQFVVRSGRELLDQCSILPCRTPAGKPQRPRIPLPAKANRQ